MQRTVAWLGLCVLLFGCGHAYRPISSQELLASPGQHEGAHVVLKGVPEVRAESFVKPTPAHDGFWQFRVNGVACVQRATYENSPRLFAMKWMAESAQRQNRDIVIRGQFKKGVIDLQSFEGLPSDTPWYRNSQPYYTYTHYYSWQPFAYRPNGRIFLP